MASDLYAERLRLTSGSQYWTMSVLSGTDPNGIRSEPTGSLLRTNDGGIWINSNGGTEWLKLGSGVLTGSYVATGAEGSQASVTLPFAFDSSTYQVFVSNCSGSGVSAYQVPEELRTTTTFKINSTSPFALGDKLDYLAVSGSLYAGGGGEATGVVSSVVVTSADASATTVQMSTEGTLDWLAGNAFQSPPRSIAATALHTKSKGGFIADTFMWCYGGGTLTSFTQADGITIQTTAADSTANTAGLNTTTIAGIHTPSGNHTGYGYRFAVPASPTQRVCKTYLSAWSAICTVIATLSDGTTHQLVYDGTNGVQMNRCFIITYTGIGDLNVSVLITTNHQANASIKHACTTLA
jgi:hypothetical protein